jgi:myb proto-oncogene protein
MGVDPVTHQQLPPDHHLDAATTSAALLPESLLWAAAAAAAATLGGALDTGAIMQAQLLQQLLHAVGSNNGTANLIGNLAAANAMVNSTSSIVPNLLLQDQMNMLSTGVNYLQPGYLCNISSFGQQDVVQQQVINNTTACPGTSSSTAAEPADQLGYTASDPAPVEEFAGLLEPMMEMPALCSLEGSDSFWKDILEDSYSL